MLSARRYVQVGFVGFALIFLIHKPAAGQNNSTTPSGAEIKLQETMDETDSSTDSSTSLAEDLKSLQDEVRQIREKINSSSDEPNQSLAKSSSGAFAPLTFQRFSGLGAGASKIYFHPAPLSLGLSATLLQFTENHGPKEDTNNRNRSNVTNIAPYLGYRLSDKIIFNSKLSLRSGGAESHGFTSQQTGATTVEMAYVDFLFLEDTSLGLRLGHQPLPVGWINLLQDPIYYYSVSRPEVETYLLPSSWHENGLLLWGGKDLIHMQLGVFNGLHWKGFSSDQFISGGRQDGQEALSESLAGVARLDFKAPYMTMGFSYYYGESSQGNPALNDATLRLWDAHFKAQWQIIELTALYSEGRLNDTDALKIQLVNNGLMTNSEALAEKATGYYVTLAIDLLGAAISGNEATLPLFVRHSQYNLQEEVGPSETPDKSLHKTRTTVGLNYRPQPNVALKLDYQFRKNEVSEEDDVFEFGVGLLF